MADQDTPERCLEVANTKVQGVLNLFVADLRRGRIGTN